jgi:uncharacterized protein (UPF0305 family)
MLQWQQKAFPESRDCQKIHGKHLIVRVVCYKAVEPLHVSGTNFPRAILGFSTVNREEERNESVDLWRDGHGGARRSA